MESRARLISSALGLMGASLGLLLESGGLCPRSSSRLLEGDSAIAVSILL